jgi:hypothetical protein
MPLVQSAGPTRPHLAPHEEPRCSHQWRRERRQDPHGRGAHSFTSQLNLGTFYGLGGARSSCVARNEGMSGDI